MANTVARKYILIPNYAPLYAMHKCYGPTQAPLTKPTLTPVDIIGQLMNQTGRERVTIYEVVKTPTGFSTPVQLTKTNYRLPYEQIAGVKEETPVVKIDEPMETPKKEFVPTEVVVDEPEETPAETVVAHENVQVAEEVTLETEPAETVKELVEETSEPVTEVNTEAEVAESEEAFEAGLSTEAEREAENGVTVTTTSTEAEQNVNPYAGMTKAERKRARRAEAERRAAEEALNAQQSEDQE